MRLSRTIVASWLVGFCLLSCKQEAPEQTATVERAVQPAKAAVANGIVYAASAHLRVVDLAKRAVVARFDLNQDIREVLFTPDGRYAFVAAADGVRRFDAQTHELIAHLTKSPARRIELDETGKKLFVLEHDVVVRNDGTRTPTPFRLKELDVETGAVRAEEHVGNRILYARAATDKTHHLVVTEKGAVRIGLPPAKLSGGEAVDLGVTGPWRVRPGVLVHGTHAYVAVESRPTRIVDIDLVTGQREIYSLERAVPVAGLRMMPDAQTLLCNIGREVLFIGLKTGTIQESLALPAPHMGAEISSDGKWLYLAQVIDGTGGAVGIVSLDPVRYVEKIHLDDISPWTIGVRP